MGIENTVGKGEIACHEQFLFFPQCFQNTYKYCRDMNTRACLGKSSPFTNCPQLKKTTFENISEKEK